MWFSEFQKRMSPEFLERHEIIHDAQNMTGSQRASLSLIGGMTAGIFSVFGNNRTWVAVDSGAKLTVNGLGCAQQRLTW